MGYVIRTTSHLTVTLDGDAVPAGADVRELADSIGEVGLLRPLVVAEDGTIVDGAKRAGALRLLGASTAPAVGLHLSPTDVLQAAAIRTCCKARGLSTPDFVGASRATLDRIAKVYQTAEDQTLPRHIRLAAATGITQIGAGASANGILTKVTALLADDQALGRYPELAALDGVDAVRMADYLDAIGDPQQRQMELDVLRLTTAADEDRTLSMRVYTHMQDLAGIVDRDRADEVAAALAAAVTGSALTPALRERCLAVADQLETTAAGIRTAMNLEREHA